MNTTRTNQDKEEILRRIKNIERTCKSAVLLYESGYRGESAVFFHSAMRGIQELIEENQRHLSAGKNLPDLRSCQRYCEENDLWCLDKIGTVENWARQYASMGDRRLLEEGLGDIRRRLEILIEEMRKFMFRSSQGETAAAPHHLAIFIIAIGVCAGLSAGIYFQVREWIPKPFDRDHTFYSYASKFNVTLFTEEEKEIRIKSFDATGFDVADIGYLTNRWKIGQRDYEAVAQSSQQSGNEPRDGIWLHGVYYARKITVEVDNLGAGKTLKGFVGVADRAAKISAGGKIATPITMLVYADGMRVYRKNFTRTPGWHDFSVQLDRYTGGGIKIRVEFLMDNHLWSQVLFDLWSEKG